MSSKRHEGSTSLALSRERPEDADDTAEIIDLVHLPRGTRPTPIAYLDFEEVERLRIMSCDYYQDCLTFAAEVKWRSFHCRQCPKSPERARTATSEALPSDGAAAVIKLR